MTTFITQEEFSQTIMKLEKRMEDKDAELNLYKEHMNQQREILIELEMKYLTDVKGLKENIEEHNNILSEQEKENECKFDDLQRELNGKFDEIQKQMYTKFLCLQQDLQLEQEKFLKEINHMKSKPKDKKETVKQHQSLSKKYYQLEYNLKQITDEFFEWKGHLEKIYQEFLELKTQVKPLDIIIREFFELKEQLKPLDKINNEFLELKKQIKPLDKINDLLSQSISQKGALIKHIAESEDNCSDIKMQISKLKNEWTKSLNEINEYNVKFDDSQRQVLNNFLEFEKEFMQFKSQTIDHQTVINQQKMQLHNDMYYIKTQVFKIVNGLMEKNTPLHLACEYGLIDIALQEISKISSLNIANKEGMTPLHLACKYSLNDVFIKLLDSGVDVNVCNNEGMKPLHFACKNDMFEINKPLTIGCYSIKYKNDKSLHHFVNKDCEDISIVTKLLNNKANINCRNNLNWTPLHYAAHSGNDHIVSVLLDHKAIVNLGTNNGRTPLHLAASGGYLYDEIAYFEDYKNKYKAHIHFLTCVEGHLSVISLLLCNGAKINCRDHFDFTPLHMASFAGHKTLVIELLKHKADIECKTKKNESPLHFAARMGHADIVTYLLNKGACVNSIDSDGDTPLNMAAATGNVSTIANLLNYRADISCKNKEGKTALQLAIEMERKHAITILQNASITKRKKLP